MLLLFWTLLRWRTNVAFLIDTYFLLWFFSHPLTFIHNIYWSVFFFFLPLHILSFLFLSLFFIHLIYKFSLSLHYIVTVITQITQCGINKGALFYSILFYTQKKLSWKSASCFILKGLHTSCSALIGVPCTWPATCAVLSCAAALSAGVLPFPEQALSHPESHRVTLSHTESHRVTLSRSNWRDLSVFSRSPAALLAF